MPKAVDYKHEFVVEDVPIERLLAHPENPKLHPQDQLEAIDGSIQDFGWLIPLVVNKRTWRILDGHGRFETAGNRGAETLPCRIVDVDEPTERRIIASLDRVGEMRKYDDTALASLVSACMQEGGILHGWSEDNIEDLLAVNEPATVATTKVSERATDGDGAPEIAPEVPSSTNGEGSAAGSSANTAQDVRQPAQVRMVQLFFSAEEHEEFERLVGALAETYGVNTPSDVVLTALRNSASEELP